ncbi:MAG: 23S rRNA (pseudouridine(1915)-N(3))-methyltransferase RlmH [Gemmatimonadota bacterium]
MTITVLVVGRVRGKLAPPVEEYERRASRYWRLEVVEVAAGVGGGRDDPERVMAAESERLLARLPPGAEVVALTRDGTSLPSRAMAEWLQDHALHGSPGVVVIIGGAHGLHSDVLERARRRVSLSAMTLPHEMARLVLAEQLYRAGTIVRGEPYHKGP